MIKDGSKKIAVTEIHLLLHRRLIADGYFQ